MQEDFAEHEALAKQLNDPFLRNEYAAPYDNYQVGIIPKILGAILVGAGDLVYGSRPSYSKFKAIEVVARIPYQSWEVASYTLLTAFYGNEARAIELTKTSAFSRHAQDNETMHVVVVTQISKHRKCTGWFRHAFIPLLFAFFYFWIIYLLYMFSKKASLELNYLFENHAYQQYSEFLMLYGHDLKHAPCDYEFLRMYGRHALCEYEFFELVRNDELIHRNRTIRELEMRKR